MKTDANFSRNCKIRHPELHDGSDLLIGLHRRFPSAGRSGGVDLPERPRGLPSPRNSGSRRAPRAREGRRGEERKADPERIACGEEGDPAKRHGGRSGGLMESEEKEVNQRGEGKEED